MKQVREVNRSSRQLALLKNVGPRRMLTAKIGCVDLELWEYPKGDAEPYACLIGYGARVTLGPLQATLLCQAIQEFKEAIAGNQQGRGGADLQIEVEGLALELHLSKPRNPAAGRLVFSEIDRSFSLSPLELGVLANMLSAITPVETPDTSQGQ